MEKMTISVCLNKTEGSTLELFIIKHWLGETGYGIQEIFLLMRNLVLEI